jgi:hypothetical protein
MTSAIRTTKRSFFRINANEPVLVMPVSKFSQNDAGKKMDIVIHLIQISW